jgi:hypothetical protein
MKNRIDIDRSHSRAIVQEIGERLQQYLRAEPELPPSIRRQVDRLRESRRASRLQLFPMWNHGFRNAPKKDVSRDVG